MSNAATVPMIEEADATGRVAEIYTDIKAVKGIDFVPNFWKTIAVNLPQLESVWASLKRLMHPDADGHTSRLDPVVREMIAVAVSATNGCDYCINSHTAALAKLGCDPETVGEVLAVAGLFNMTNAIASGFQIEPDVRPDFEVAPAD